MVKNKMTGDQYIPIVVVDEVVVDNVVVTVWVLFVIKTRE
jgi:hypothetical protein